MQKFFKNFKVYAIPAIEGIQPADDYTKGGATCTITGTDFVTTAFFGREPLCRFGDMIVNATVVDETSLTCKTPQYPRVEETSVWVSFNGQNWHSSPVRFNFVADPICYTCQDAVAPPGFVVFSAASFTASELSLVWLVAVAVAFVAGPR